MRESYRTYLTINDLAYMTGTRKRIIERIVSLELISPCRQDPEPCFEPEIIPIVKRLIRLHHQLGVSWSSMGLVLALLERIDELESRIPK